MSNEMGHAEALRRIAECKVGRHEKLDIGDLGLDAIPEELLELGWLKKLNLGVSRRSWTRRNTWYNHKLESNSIQVLPKEFAPAFPALQWLGLSCTDIDNLEAVAGLEQLQHLNCEGTEVRSLEPLKCLAFLKVLNCSSTGIESLEPLSGLSRLETLDCDLTKISSLSSLAKCRNLTRLNCSETMVESLEPLRGLWSLTRLKCSGTSISSLAPLEGLPNLTRLDCGGTNLRSLEGLESLPRLARLSCGGNEIIDLEPLRNLPSLTRLSCGSTSISSLEPLCGLPSLKKLECTYTELRGLDGLENLPSLEWLNCENAGLSDLSPLRGLPRLAYLNCSHNPLRSLRGLEGMPRLKEIWCPQTEIETLEGLRQLPSLEKLNCCATQLNSLEALKNFPSLSELICFSTPLRGLAGLENLPRLKVLECSGTRVSDLAPLRGLPLLTVLSCGDTEISDLGPLRGLPCLTELNCSSTRISDLEPLRGLPRLRKLDCCSTNIRSLGPLADVPVLARLSCSGTAIADLAPLANHPGLEELLCSHNDIDSLAPLKGLPRLSTLDAGATKLTTLSELEDLPLLSRLSFSNTEIDDLRPLAALQNLSYVDCYSARVTSLEGLEGLSRLVTLNCDKTPLTSLEGLENSHALERLVCSETKISSFDPLLPLLRLRTLVAEHCGVVSASPELWLKPSLKQVELYGTNLKGVPDEVLAGEDCIYELAAHCADLGDNPERLSDVKLMVLGNGRVGKTQLVRRLQGKPYQSDSVSTHGIMVQPTPLPIGEGGEIVPVKIWDFGGQDMYHATHALFYRTRATFLVCWHPRFENEETVNDDGFLSRNHKLTYWLQNIGQFGGRNSAILVAQTQCDSACEAEQETAKIASRLEDHRGYKKLDLTTSAATGQGIEALIAALKMAYSSINPPLIGPGRAKVKRLLEERLARIDEAREVHGEELPEPVQALRTLTVDEFKDLCDDAGQISDPDMFLKFLHDAGVVFWREGSLQDRIIVDQNWALEAIYALFNRDHCVAHLRAAGGRFTAADVGRWLWDKDFSRRDQHLFLAMMETCGICFEAPDRSYVAPEFLPEDPSREVQKNWPTALGFGTVVQIFAPRERKVVFRSPVESRTLIHAVICSLGRLYGETGAFWATGLQVRDDELECVGMIAQSPLPADVRRQSDGQSGITIRVRPLRHANDENLELFLKRLCDAIANRAEQLGLEIRRSQ